MNRLTNQRPDQDVILTAVEGGRSAVSRLAQMGLFPGERIRILDCSRSGPVMISVKGCRLALGHGLACQIRVKGAQA